MAKVMRAAVAEKRGEPLVLRELPVPEPGAGEILVRIVTSGVCHTDIHVIDGDWPIKMRLPIIPGHEGCGYVAALGSGVTSVREGDRVGVYWLNSACGSCEFCNTGRETLCMRQQNTGYSSNGTYADYCVASGHYAVPLPEGDFDKLTPIMCAGVTTYKALKEIGARPGNWIVISGLGGTGHLAVQYAKAMGLHVAGIDIVDDKLEQAKCLGADTTINAEREFPVNRINKLTGGAHGTLITAVAPKAFEQGVRMLRRGGTCMLVGVPPGAFPLSIFDTVVNGLTVRGSITGTRQDLREALQLASEGKISAVVESEPLAEVNSAIEAIRKGRVKGRVVLQMA